MMPGSVEEGTSNTAVEGLGPTEEEALQACGGRTDDPNSANEVAGRIVSTIMKPSPSLSG